MFELECNRGITNFNNAEAETNKHSEDSTTSPVPGSKNILLKGQMKYISDINCLIYLCSPV